MTDIPKLWWSPTFGLITQHESRSTGEMLFWVYNDSRVSLRRVLGTGEDSNPPLPEDAVQLGVLGAPPSYDENPCPQCGGKVLLQWSGVRCSKCAWWDCI